MDDRTPAERGEIPEGADLSAYRDEQLAGDGVQRLHKSRYASVSTYIYRCSSEQCQKTISKYNDVPCPIDAGEGVSASGVFE